MTLNRKALLIFLAVSVILLIGMTFVSATDVKDINNTKVSDNRDIVQSSNDVNKMVQSKAGFTSKDVKVEVEDTNSKYINAQTNITENKEITKNSKTNVKQATIQSVENYAQLSELLTTSTDSDLEVNLMGDETYTGNAKIVLNQYIKNLTINGNARTIDFEKSSGFINITSVNLTLNNITIKNCKDTTGSVIYASGSYNNITIADSTFEKNTANVGGVIAVLQNSKVSIVRSVLFNNSASFDINQFGGVINIKQNSRLSINDSVLSYNTAERGGVIYSKCEGSVRNYIDMCNVTMKENDAIYGGILHNENTITNIINSTIKFINNSAYKSSAAYGSSLFNYGSLSVLTLNNSCIDLGNDAFWKIYNTKNGKIIIDNCTLANSTWGTVIENYGATLTLINNNIVDNYIPSAKAFIENRESSTVDVNANRINNNTCDFYFFYNYLNAASTINIRYNNITNNTALIMYVNYNSGKYNITNNMIDNNTYGMYNLYNLGTATFSQNNVTNDNYLILNIRNEGNQATMTVSENNFINNSGQRALLINKNGVLTISHNNFTDNCLTNGSYLIIDSLGGGKYNIDNNIFINNTNNTRDMLIYEDSSTQYTVTNNVYIDNFLEDNITPIDPISVHGDEDKPFLVNVNLRSIYNNVIVNGTIILYDENNQELNRSNVTDGVSLVTIPTKRLSLGLNKLNVTYETLSKHYQNNSITLEVTRTVDPSIVVEDSYETELYSPVEIVGNVYNETGVAITSGIVNLTINEETFETTFEGGRFNLTYPSKVAGEFIITAKYYENEGDTEPKIINEDKTVTVNRIVPIITLNVNPTSTIIGENVTIYGSLTDKLNNKISDRYINIFVDDKLVANVKTNSTGEFNYTYVADTLGDLIVNATFNGDTGATAMYDNTTNHTSLFVYSMNTSVLLNVSDINYTDTELINFTINETKAAGLITVEVTSDVEGFEDILQYFVFNGEILQLPLKDLDAGTYQVTVSYEGDIKYNGNTTTKTFKVNKKDNYKLNVTAQNIIFGEEEIIIVNLPSDAKGLVTVNITGMSPTTINLSEGNVLTIPGGSLLPGDYEVNISYSDNNYELKTNYTKFTVSTPVITIYDSQIIYENESVTIHGSVRDYNTNIEDDAEIILNINGTKYTLSINDYDKGLTHKFTVNGTYTVNASLVLFGKTITTSDNIQIVVKSSANTTIKNATLTVKTPGDAIANEAVNITGTLKDEDGKAVVNTPVNVTVNGKKYIAVTDSNGNYQVEVNNVKVGQNNVTVVASADNYNIKSVTAKFTGRLLKSKITVSKISDAKVGDNVTVSGKLIDERNSPIKDAEVSVKVNNKNYDARTDNKGNYVLYNPDLAVGVDNVTVSYASTQYTPSSAKTTFKVTKLNVKVTVQAITGIIGEDITLTAYVTDERGAKVSGGNLVFKLNGKTLRIDGRFDSNASPLKLKVENGVVKYTIKADLYLRNGKNITASYSGSYKYNEAKGNVAKANIKKRTASIKVTITPKRAIQNSDIVLTATLKDNTPNAKNATCIITGGDVIFKVNGVTVKDAKGRVKRVKVNSTTVNLAYHIPSGMGGKDASGLKNYTVEAVYNNSMFYPDTRNTSSFYVQQSIVVINFIKTSVKNNVLSVKATFTDYENKYLIGDNKVCVKINGKTYQENNKTKYFTVTNGKVNLSGIKLAKGTTVKSVTLVTGEREGYLGARATTQNITVA